MSRWALTYILYKIKIQQNWLPYIFHVLVFTFILLIYQYTHDICVSIDCNFGEKKNVYTIHAATLQYIGKLEESKKNSKKNSNGFWLAPSPLLIFSSPPHRIAFSSTSLDGRRFADSAQHRPHSQTHTHTKGFLSGIRLPKRKLPVLFAWLPASWGRPQTVTGNRLDGQISGRRESGKMAANIRRVHWRMMMICLVCAPSLEKRLGSSGIQWFN